MIFAFCIFSSRGLFWKGDMHFLYCKHLGGRGDGTEKIFFFFSVCSEMHVVGGFAHYFGLTLQF